MIPAYFFYRRITKWNLAFALILLTLVWIIILDSGKNLNLSSARSESSNEDGEGSRRHQPNNQLAQQQQKRKQKPQHHRNNKEKLSKNPMAGPMLRIPCVVNKKVSADLGILTTSNKNNQKIVSCLFDDSDDETYIPFKFIQQYFEVYGQVQEGPDDSLYLEWSHSYSKVFPNLAKDVYDFKGKFLQFSSFDVENRQRVLCVTAQGGVPISTQWDSRGYFYATQIGQYGLSHYSKFVQQNEDQREEKFVLEDGKNYLGDWRGEITRVTSLDCVHFDSKISIDIPDKLSDNSRTTGLNSKNFNFVYFDLQYKQDVVISIVLQTASLSFVLKLTPEDGFLSRDGNKIIFGYGSSHAEGTWLRFTRNILNDLKKGIGSKKAFDGLVRKSAEGVKIVRIEFEGVGCLTNLSLSYESDHLRYFNHAADWFLNNQNSESGGWSNQIPFNKDREKYPAASEIESGWISAMASGHAMSILSRAWASSETQEEKYLDAMAAALAPFERESHSGRGVLAYFNGDTSLPWYEEYPTNPPTFILNGFMYSLLGLYDAYSAFKESSGEDRIADMEKSLKLFSAGVRSLEKMAPLYDTGDGTVYDLRHFTMRGVEPKIARWDYHSLHVNLLYVLGSILSQNEFPTNQKSRGEFFINLANRWRGYMLGKKASHN